MNVEIKSAIMGKATVYFQRRPNLCLKKCDICGTEFNMEPWCNDAMEPGQIIGTFDKSSSRGGNIFNATVCSLACADLIFRGGWKKMREYRDFAKKKAVLVRIEVGMTSLFVSKGKAIDRWNQIPLRRSP